MLAELLQLNLVCVQVNWRPVFGGFILQFYFATLILKWDVGYRVFSFLGEEARRFLAYTDVGSRFVFGDKFSDHIFVMQVSYLFQICGILYSFFFYGTCCVCFRCCRWWCSSAV